MKTGHGSRVTLYAVGLGEGVPAFEGTSDQVPRVGDRVIELPGIQILRGCLDDFFLEFGYCLF
jgi:hypothetical protein